MAAWGLDIWMGRTAQVSLGHGAFLAVGAYTSALLSRQGTPWLASLPAALLVTGALGLVVGHATLRLVGPRLALATLALQVVVEQALTQGGALTGAKRFTGVFTITLQPPKDAETLRANPLGLYVRSLSWSEDLVTGER